MRILFPFLTTVVAFGVVGCSQTPEQTETKTVQAPSPTKVMSSSKDVTEKDLSLGPQNNVTQNMQGNVMTSILPVYWVKKPGTMVYDRHQQKVRSLRLQPKVTIYHEVDGWGLINKNKDEWVKMSDITLTRPEGMLDGPEDSNLLPRVTLEEMMNARK